MKLIAIDKLFNQENIVEMITKDSNLFLFNQNGNYTISNYEIVFDESGLTVNGYIPIDSTQFFFPEDADTRKFLGKNSYKKISWKFYSYKD